MVVHPVCFCFGEVAGVNVLGSVLQLGCGLITCYSDESALELRWLCIVTEVC